MRKIKELLAVLIIVSSSPLQAMPVEFNFDGLLLGSTEILPEIVPDCLPGRVCKRISGIKVKLPKPGLIVSFPDVGLTPSPGGKIPIPYPNVGGNIAFTTGEFTTPSGELAKVSVGNIVDTNDFVSFDIFVESPSGYMLPSILFIGKDANGQSIERELILNSTSVPEPSSFMLLVLGLALLAGIRAGFFRGFRRRQLF